MAYQGFIPGRFPEKELKQTRVMEIAPDIWMIEGYLSMNFFLKPPSSNCFIMRDKDMVLLIDTGTYPHYREKILKILDRFRKDGAKKLVLMLTQGHFDHVANNDVILEAGYREVEFLLPEAEVTTLDLFSHWTGEYRELREYYDTFREMMPLAFPTGVVRIINSFSQDLADKMMASHLRKLFGGINTMAHTARILPDSSRVKRRFGDVEFLGWEVGRFFAVHDATHSPGHLSFYDPEHKVFLTGDATLEINPPFLNSSLNNCIAVMKQYKRFAEQGFINLATDAHRSKIWSSMLIDKTGEAPMSPLQLQDTFEGGATCAAYFSLWESYYQGMKDEVLGILKQRGEATVHQIIKDFKASKNPYARFKTLMKFPQLPSRMDVMIANVLREGKIPKRKEGSKIIFSNN
jgi:glyoxylase-like metal-dependent hydrolase (beta-lactamase superfamily II)